ncbi:MAG TPA: bifunctional shikimate kinase/3-dehydroquinate synthase [Solirubrobacteraceae bacterium]|nr:bifunctional shikimate kinase/3-dehydroquinate synthase [Solirubrobacteraceae bacterium]
MGAGKTSAARAAAAAIGASAVDSDHVLEQRLGCTIEEYFASHGERAFRAAEEEAVAELLESPPSPVLSLGGGAIASERVRPLLERHTVVLLDVDEDTAWRRAGGRRPLARDRSRFAALLAERTPLYDSLADAVLTDSSRETVRRAVPALRALAHAPAGTRLLWATAASGEYPVYVGEGLIGSGFRALAGDGHLVTDANVGALYGEAVEAVSRVAIEPGETAKTLPTAGRVLEALAEAGLDHDGHVIALGGGVVGDLAGFCAAVYQRGVRVVQVPTTLVAQVDSAYGGKTGVDLPQGKNYAGVYHQPAAVLADPRALSTLPGEELAAGWAEVIKTALIAGGTLWKRVRSRSAEADRDLVLACARTKLAVVAADERDAGARQSLNLGHTVGHAIETVTGYARYRHGEAVGLGLLAALTLSAQPALREEVAELLAERGLPTRLDPAIDPAAVVAATARDKKRRGGRVGFALVEAPGDVRTGMAVSPDDLRAAVAELERS